MRIPFPPFGYGLQINAPHGLFYATSTLPCHFTLTYK